MTELYLVRHGQSWHNRNDIIAGQLDSALTEQGFKDARSVASLLDSQSFDRIYCSDLLRARQTAETIAEALNLKGPFVFSRLLRELDYGDFTNRPVKEAFQFLNYKVVQDQRYPGGESFQDLEARLTRFVAQLRQESLGQRLLVTAHAGSIRMLLIVVDPAHRQDYLAQTFSNRYLGKLELNDRGALIQYRQIQNPYALST
ncbi:MAG: histidine phosphatase family protein [Acidobacteriota bacterium]